MPAFPPMEKRFASSPFTSGITSGQSGSMRKALLLSITIAPRSTAAGPNFLDMDPPALKSAMSTSLKESAVSSSTTYSLPSKSTFWPADLCVGGGAVADPSVARAPAPPSF